MSKAERLQIPRQPMPTQAADERRRNFAEVNLGYAAPIARHEAERCLACAHPRCSEGCPVGVKIREFVELIMRGDLLGAAAKIREDNVLPAITGRVCPQERQCEGSCVLGHKHEPLGIGYLERFVADYEAAQFEAASIETEKARALTTPNLPTPSALPPSATSTGRRVAIVGSGPAGLSAAGDLVRAGHAVTVFEALHEPGGVLMYGIPEFRLPKEVVRREIDRMRRTGVQFETNVVIGKTITIDELLGEEGFDAVFIATGAGLPKFLGVPGEHLVGVYSANEFLTRVNLLHADQFPLYDEPIYDCRDKVVAVIGGGNTAIDAVRTAVRLGARRAMLVYRRTEADMPARVEEIRHAREEGVEIVALTTPVAFVGDEKGRLTIARCVRMDVGPTDQSGRSSVKPVAGSEFDLPIDVAVIALGAGANPLVQSATPRLRTNAHGYIVADPETLQTSQPGVFAGGDIVTGSATVILAMAAGRRAARAIGDYLNRQKQSG